MRRLAQFMLLVLIGFGLVYTVMFSPLFIVEDVDVRGSNLPKEEILALAEFKSGQNLLFYRKENAINHILQDARIRSVRIEKKWPNQLIFEIDARKPFVIIHDAGSAFTLDSTGLVIAINQPDETLIQMRGFSISEASLGEAITSPDAATLKKALDLANLVSQTDINPAAISYEDAHIVLRIEDVWKIKFGSANQIEKQFSAFKTIFDQLVAQGTTGGIIDVTNPEVAVFKPFE